MIDNNSTDGSREFFGNRFPQVQFAWKSENAGFASANNEALKQARGEQILFLNPDTILAEDSLEKCLAFFNQQKNTGALGVKMIDGSGNFLPESKRGFPSAFTSFCKMTGLTRLFPHSKTFARYYLGHLPEDKNNEVDVLSGAFMMINKKVLDDVGSFDEAYFMYAEDIDLSYRIQKAGYQNFYFAGTSIVHFKGESTVKQTAAYIHHFYGTMILFVQRHYSGISKSLYVLLLKVLIAVKSLFATKEVKQDNKNVLGKAFVLADETSFENMKVRLERNFSQLQLIKNITEAESGSTIIFCEQVVSFAAIIALMQQYKNQYSFFIHADKTNSIIGSSDKNNPGIVNAC